MLLMKDRKINSFNNGGNMKKVTWEIVISDDKIAILENLIGFSPSVETTMALIGLLENLKQHQLKKIGNVLTKTKTKGENN